jgi:hypothetical protein
LFLAPRQERVLFINVAILAVDSTSIKVHPDSHGALKKESVEKAPELGYQTLAHPGEPMIVTYDENGQRVSTHVPYERFKELYAQARENPREAEEVYRQAQKEELQTLIPATGKSELASGKDIEIIEVKKGETYIGYISDYGKGHAVQTLGDNTFLRVIHDFDKAPELKRHAYFPGTSVTTRTASARLSWVKRP